MVANTGVISTYYCARVICIVEKSRGDEQKKKPKKTKRRGKNSCRQNVGASGIHFTATDATMSERSNNNADKRHLFAVDFILVASDAHTNAPPLLHPPCPRTHLSHCSSTMHVAECCSTFITIESNFI